MRDDAMELQFAAGDEHVRPDASGREPSEQVFLREMNDVCVGRAHGVSSVVRR
jgi:hypothetical protein